MEEKHTGKNTCLFDRNVLTEKRSSATQNVKKAHHKNYQSKC